MKKILYKFSKINIVITLIVFALYFIIRFKLTFLDVNPKGDEVGFVIAFKRFIEFGYVNSNIEGNSILFNLLASLFYKMGFNELYSLKLTSLTVGIFTVITLWYFFNSFKISKFYKWVAFLTSLNAIIVSGLVLLAINDTILVFLILLFFVLVFKAKYNKNDNRFYFILIGFTVGFMFITRLLSILFIPSISIVIAFILFKNKMKTSKILANVFVLIISFLTIVMMFNIPSLKENGKLSFHEKKTKTENLTWSQLQYLSHLKVQEGTLQYGQHVSWNDVENHLIENGNNSLPKTTFDSITFSFQSTLKEFFIDLMLEAKPFTRLLGVLFWFCLLLFGFQILKKRISFFSIFKDDILVFSLIYIFIVCFIIIYVVENRWLASVFILLPIVFLNYLYNYFEVENNRKYLGITILNIQLTSLAIMNIPYVFQNFYFLF